MKRVKKRETERERVKRVKKRDRERETKRASYIGVCVRACACIFHGD